MTLAASTGAGIITAVATCLTALGGVIVAFTVLLPMLRQTRSIHTIVNQQHTDDQRHIIALSKQVIDLGGTPVVNQALPVIGFPDALPGQPTT